MLDLSTAIQSFQLVCGFHRLLQLYYYEISSLIKGQYLTVSDLTNGFMFSILGCEIKKAVKKGLHLSTSWESILFSCQCKVVSIFAHVKNLQKLCIYPRYCFPFGRPEGALKATLSLLERVSMRMRKCWWWKPVIIFGCFHSIDCILLWFIYLRSEAYFPLP